MKTNVGDKKIIAAFFLLFLSVSSYSQAHFTFSNSLPFSISDTTVILMKDTVAKIVSFTAKKNGNKIYFKWSITNLKDNGVFVIYRSMDGKDFQNIGTKKGIGVPISNEIAYYFSYETTTGEAYYKIDFISNKSKYLCSEILNIDSNLFK